MVPQSLSYHTQMVSLVNLELSFYTKIRGYKSLCPDHIVSLRDTMFILLIQRVFAVKNARNELNPRLYLKV